VDIVKILRLDRPRPEATFEKYQPHLENEVQHTWDAYKRGIVRDIYFRQDRPGVAIFLECESASAAQRTLGDLPLMKAGLIDFEVIPLGPFVNWEMLFGRSDQQ
jgi:hypothetical protein